MRKWLNNKGLSSFIIFIIVTLICTTIAYAAPGDFSLTWGSNGTGNGQFDQPMGVGIDGAGNVYVADTGNNRIQNFDSNGCLMLEWGSSG